MVEKMRDAVALAYIQVLADWSRTKDYRYEAAISALRNAYPAEVDGASSAMKQFLAERLS